jgi:hypothetical protein
MTGELEDLISIPSEAQFHIFNIQSSLLNNGHHEIIPRELKRLESETSHTSI